jgi:hypothetical protein
MIVVQLKVVSGPIFEYHYKYPGQVSISRIIQVTIEAELKKIRRKTELGPHLIGKLRPDPI